MIPSKFELHLHIIIKFYEFLAMYLSLFINTIAKIIVFLTRISVNEKLLKFFI